MEKIAEREKNTNLEERIIREIKLSPLNSKELLRKLKCSEKLLTSTLRLLLDNSIIIILPNQKFKA